MTNGLGFLIWRLRTILPIEKTIDTLVSIGTQWVSLKLRDGTGNYNYIDARGNVTGKPDFLLEVVEKFRDAGISVGGWGFVYTDRMKQQAEAARAAVSTFGLDHWLVDAEEVQQVGAFWKTADNLPGKAREYMDNLKLPSGFPVVLCSYRFPTLHAPFPFSTFTRHSAHTFSAPQMYWMMANNPGAQLERTQREYDAIRKQPMIPIGVAAQEFGWQPTPGQIREFVQKAKELGMPGWGFWVLDEALYREDWLAAMTDTGAPPPPPPPPPPDVPKTGVHEVFHVKTTTLNVRNNIIPSVRYGRTPGVSYPASSVWFTLPRGAPVEALETILDGRNTWVRIGQRQFVAKVYDDITYLE